MIYSVGQTARFYNVTRQVVSTMIDREVGSTHLHDRQHSLTDREVLPSLTVRVTDSWFLH